MLEVIFLILIVLCLVIALKALIQSRKFQLFGGLHYTLPTSDKVVALTFDDGPNPEYCGDILDMLESRGIKCTFFLIGRCVAEHPRATKNIIDAGHQIGMHSYEHRRMVFKSRKFILNDLELAKKAIRKVGYNDPLVFRPPYCCKLFTLPQILNNTEVKTITWSLEPDSKYTNVEGIVNEVISNIKPGSIVLMHVMTRERDISRQALPVLIDDLLAKGYRFVTVNEYLDG